MSEKQGFGKRLRTLREKRGWKQGEAAAKLKVAQSTYAGYESEARSPSIEVLNEMLRIFEVTYEELFLGKVAAVAESPPENGYKTKYIEALEELNRLQKQLLEQKGQELKQSQEQTQKLG